MWLPFRSRHTKPKKTSKISDGEDRIRPQTCRPDCSGLLSPPSGGLRRGRSCRHPVPPPLPTRGTAPFAHTAGMAGPAGSPGWKKNTGHLEIRSGCPASGQRGTPQRAAAAGPSDPFTERTHNPIYKSLSCWDLGSPKSTDFSAPILHFTEHQ